MSTRPPFTSKTAWDALGVESGEESEEEVLTDSGAQAEVDRYDAMLSSSVTRSSDVVQRVRVDSQAVQERNQEAKGVGPHRETPAGKGRTRRRQGAEGRWR